MKFDPSPPAIVRKQELSRDARILLCKTIAATVRTRKRLNLESAIELGGHLLALKSVPGQHGRWLPLLEEMGIDRSSACLYMRFAKCAPGAHLEDCGSITEAKQKLKLGDDEEQEIGEGEETQYDAFPEDEGVLEGMSPDEEPGNAKVYCDACQRARSAGLTLPKRCKACIQARKEAKEFTRKDPSPPKGGFSLHAVTAHCKAIVRHLDNLCKDYGYLDEKGMPKRPEWMEEIVVALRQDYESLKVKAKQLREELKTKKE